MKINKVAVIGAGTMGSGIAGQIANAGVEVWLLDLPGDGNPNVLRDWHNAGVRVLQLQYGPKEKHNVSERLGYGTGDFPESERAAAKTIALPIYPELSGSQAEYVIEKLLSSLSDSLKVSAASLRSIRERLTFSAPPSPEPDKAIRSRSRKHVRHAG